MNYITHYCLETLTSRQFEILAANYAKSVAPDYNWILTKKTGDYNHDFEAILDDCFKWGEAKHTRSSSVSVSRNRWDPTLVSAILKNNVNELFLVTCGWIPLEYIVRAEHYKTAIIKRVYYINSYLIDDWLNNNSVVYDSFNEQNIDMHRIMQSIKTNYTHISPKINCNIGVFSIATNVLEPKSSVEKMITYEINITFFLADISTITIQLPDSFVVIDLKVNSLSPNNNNKKNDYKTAERAFKLDKGYGQIIINGFFNSYANDKETIIAKINNTKSFKKTLSLFGSCPLNKDKLSEMTMAENIFDSCVMSGTNAILYSHFLGKNDLIRNNFYEKNGEYYYYRFVGTACDDALTICRIISKIYLGVDNGLRDEKSAERTIQSALNLCPYWLSNIFLGTTNYIYAIYAINYLFNDINAIDSSYHKVRIPSNCILFIDNLSCLNKFFYNVLTTIMNYLVSEKNALLIVLNSSDVETRLSNEIVKKSISEKETINTIWKKTSITESETNQLYNYGKKYYNNTDFFKALFFFELIYQKNGYLCNNVGFIFKYADCLNHCDSMRKAQEQFEKVIAIGDPNNSLELKIILEARTEVFSLRFWRLEISDLVNEIDTFLDNYYHQLYTDKSNNRSRYAFYNCINRKMVTQYLEGDYENAEKTFTYYISTVDSKHLNYLAFAYMDSARGLYAYDITISKKRLDKARRILKKLYSSGYEQRRYLDCLVEIEYVKFIVNYNNNKNPAIELLEKAVRNVRNQGYKSMLIKCYLKLANCYLALKKIEFAEKYLSYVRLNCNFSDDIRSAVLYNQIYSNLYKVKNTMIIKNKNISKDFKNDDIIIFNCNKKIDSKSDIILESRIW